MYQRCILLITIPYVSKKNKKYPQPLGQPYLVMALTRVVFMLYFNSLIHWLKVLEKAFQAGLWYTHTADNFSKELKNSLVGLPNKVRWKIDLRKLVKAAFLFAANDYFLRKVNNEQNFPFIYTRRIKNQQLRRIGKFLFSDAVILVLEIQ